jgi:hypothetical protein
VKLEIRTVPPVKLGPIVSLASEAAPPGMLIAASIPQLFSDNARCIAGQVLAVDRGWCIA